MRLHVLGSGTSFGVPEIGCHCATCLSDDPRDRRLRSSVWVEHEGVHLIVDTTPDFRQQCLRAQVPRVDALLITHTHADHIFGMDDVRIYNRLQHDAIPVYLPSQFAPHFSQLFGYTLHEAPAGLTRPRFSLREIGLEPLVFGSLTVQPVVVQHGSEPIAGYLFSSSAGRIAYLTDCKELPDETRAAVAGAEVIILGALWKREWRHASHMNLEEALVMAEELGGGQTFLTHLTHHMGCHRETSETLPDGVALAWDGLELQLG